MVTSLWWRVDYFTKILTPWKNLWHGPVPVERSLLPDYITPIHPVALYKAARGADSPVLVSGLVYLSLKLAVRLCKCFGVCAKPRPDDRID